MGALKISTEKAEREREKRVQRQRKKCHNNNKNNNSVNNNSDKTIIMQRDLVRDQSRGTERARSTVCSAIESYGGI